MDIMNKTRNMMPRTTLLIGLGQKNYELYQVFAELIDNSLNKGAKNIFITVRPNSDIEILDDGNGQDAEGLLNAMDLGTYTPDVSSLSTYGLGIKQLWSWLGKEIFIATKKLGIRYVYTLHLNIDEIIKTYDYLSDVQMEVKGHNSFKIGLEEYAKKDKHFWLLRISHLNKRNLEINTIIRNRLSATFRDWVKNGTNITVNNIRLKELPDSKLMILPSYNVERKTFENKTWGISGFWGITEKGQKGRVQNYGASTYHNGRMITCNDREIFGIGETPSCKKGEHPNFYRLTAEVHFTSPSIFDGKKLSNKNGWIRDKDYETVQSWLFDTIVKPFEKELAKVRGNEEQLEQQKINEAIGQTASPHLKDAFPDLKRPHKEYERVDDKTDKTEQIKCDVRTQSDPENPSEPTTETEEGADQKPKDPHRGTRPHIPLYINNEPYEVKIVQTTQYSPDDGRYDFAKDDVAKVITIYINENRSDVNLLDAKQRVPLYIEWIAEVFIRITKPSLADKEFLEEREKALLQLNFAKWYPEIKMMVEELEFLQPIIQTQL